MTLPRVPCPPGLIGATVFYWGWQLNLWPIGLTAAIILEAANSVRLRIDISEKQFIRLSDLTSVAIVITGAVLFQNYSSDGLFYLVQWLPAVMFILLAAQYYSENQLIPLTAIVATLRKRSRLDSSGAIKSIDLRLPYVFITLIATSVGAPRTQIYYCLSGVLILWILLGVKPRHRSPLVWLLFSGLALSLGFVAQIGLNQLQGTVQELTTRWFQADWSQRNFNRNSTAIGQIGRLKMSEEIIMRIRNNDPASFRASTLLQQAEYNRYSGGSWHVDDRTIESLSRQPETGSWYLSNNTPATSGQLNISTYLRKGEGVLALPRESYAIDYDKPADLSINKYGSVRIENAPNLLDFTVNFGINHQQSEETSDKDMEIPAAYKKLMAEVVKELGLDRLTPIQAAQKLKNYFEENYKYSLIQDEFDLVFNPLSQFLRKSRKGHCEYFATAGALILRAAGIPSRYASGFLMSEYDPERKLFIVRERHAHAWTLAYIDGHWVEQDYTPSTWAALEAESAPWWQDIYDMVSHVTHATYQWWIAKPRNLMDYVLMVGLFIATIYSLKKIPFKKIKLQWDTKAENKKTAVIPGSDSPFYKIIKHLEEDAIPRQPGESIKGWLQRITKSYNIEMTVLQPLVDQHYQYRFNARNGVVDRERFSKNVESWLKMQTQNCG